MGTKLAWQRVGHVFVCIAEGEGALDDRTFEPYFEDLSQMGFSKFLSVATGSPSVEARQRQRILGLPGAADVTMAVVFDGSALVRGLAVAFSWFMPRVKVFPAGNLGEALDYLDVHGDVRARVIALVPVLQQRVRTSAATNSVASAR